MTNNKKQQQQQQQPLLTPASVAMSLAPPRVPPRGSALRKLYTHPKSAHRNYARNNHDAVLLGHHDDHDEDHDHYQSHGLTSRMLQLLPSPELHHPHPHLRIPTSLSIPDAMTRFLGAVLPLETQHSVRDNGYFRSIADGMVKATCPMIGAGHWKEAREFLELSAADAPRLPSSTARRKNDDGDNDDGGNGGEEKRKRRRWTRKRVPYGDHPMQYIDLFLPSAKCNNNHSSSSNNNSNNILPVRGTIFFVHGGAWGSGQPWMYRLVAPAFLKLNFAVVIAGYRTYPDAPAMDDQSGDVKAAWERSADVLNEYNVVPITEESHGGENYDDDRDGWVGNVVMGHSSGAHVALLLIVDLLEERTKASSSPIGRIANNNNNGNGDAYPWNADYFVGLSGPYDISYHFDYEAGRGVEQISPMKPICGHSRDNFDKASPVKRLLSLLAEQRSEEESNMPSSSLQLSAQTVIQQLAPPMILVHGIEDSTVPFTATSDAARMLRSCGVRQVDEVYLEETGHQDVVMHFMMGGPAKDLVLDWLRKCRERKRMSQKMHSRL